MNEESLSFEATIQFGVRNQIGEPFELNAGPRRSGFEFEYGEYLLICRCFDLDGHQTFRSGHTYRVRIELPSGFAYGVIAKPGDRFRLISPPRFVVGTGVVTAPQQMSESK
jgi:hypothetical protein